MLIRTDCTWSIAVGSSELDFSHCQLLNDFLGKKANSIDIILKLLAVLENSTLCIGNYDEKFIAIRDQHKGEFKDCTGSLLSVTYVNCITLILCR